MTIADYFTDADRPGFLAFGQKLDAEMIGRIGLGVLDIADQDYSALYEDFDGSDEMIADIVSDILADEFGMEG